MITKEMMATMLANHKPFDAGDTVKLTYLPFKGDIFGSTKELSAKPDYIYTEVGDVYKVVSYTASTGTYTVLFDECTFSVPFYCLKLVRKNNGREVMVGSYEGTIAVNGKTVDIGCQSNISFEEVKTVYEAMVKVQSTYKPKPKKVVAKATKKPAAKKKAR